MNAARISVYAGFVLLAASLPASAFHPGNVDPDWQRGYDNGTNDLGIDITQAGSTPDSIHRFLAGLAPDTRRIVERACQRVLRVQVNISPPVVSFCYNAH